MNKQQHKKLNRAHGFTLLEVLVAMVVLGIGLMGVATLQFTSMKGAQDAYVRSQASFLAYAITDAMRVNADSARAGRYDIAADAAATTLNKTCIGELSDCTPEELALYDLLTWKRQLGLQLAAGNGSIVSVVDVMTGAATVTVTVSWVSMLGSAAAEDLVLELEI